MVIISPTELRNQQKKYLDLAEKEKVIVKRGKKFIKLIVSDKIDDSESEKTQWMKDFLSIPEEFRCNPFDISPSGDLFFADKRNLAAIERGFTDIEDGRIHKMFSSETLDEFLNRVEGCTK